MINEGAIKLQWVWNEELGWVGICPKCQHTTTEDEPIECNQCGTLFFKTSKPSIEGKFCFY